MYLYNTARNFLYVGDIIRNIIEIKEMHVAKMNALNNATYSMIDLYPCHSHEWDSYSLLFNERSLWYKKKGFTLNKMIAH